jgi:hypothetical protein
MLHELKTHPVLVYGKDYEIAPDHAGPCDIGERPNFGSLILAAETFLHITGENGGSEFLNRRNYELGHQPPKSLIFAGFDHEPNQYQPEATADRKDGEPNNSHSPHQGAFAGSKEQETGADDQGCDH